MGTKTIEQARALCLELGRPGLAALLEPEPVDRAARALVVGPVSSGKSSTIVSLIGEAALVDGAPLLPIGVEPLTAQLTMIETGQAAMALRASRDDGTVLSESEPARIRAVLTDAEQPFRVSQLSLAGAPRVDGWTWIDASGLGRVDEAAASRELVSLGLALADVVLLHIDVLRGVGRARPVLDLLEATANDRAGLARRLVPVLTNIRSEGRVEETEEHLAERFPGISPAVRVPWRGQIDALERHLDAWRASRGTARSDERRLDDVLRNVVAPELKRVIAAASDPELAGEIAYLEESISKARTTEQKLVASSVQAHARLLGDLHQRAAEAESAARQAVTRYGEDASRWTPDAAQREIVRTVTHHLGANFNRDVERVVAERLDALQREAEDLIRAFDTDVVTPSIARRAPGFESVVQRAPWHGGHHGVQVAISALGRGLGGNSGSVILGTQNLARMVAARTWRTVTGDTLARETVQRTIPRLVRPVGEALKFIANNQVLVAVVVEVGLMLWNAFWARDKLLAAGEELIDQWRDGVQPSMLAKAKAAVGLSSLVAAKPVHALLDEQVRDLWAGDGVDRHVSDWCALVRDTARPWEEEVASLRAVSERRAEIERRWADLETALGGRSGR